MRPLRLVAPRIGDRPVEAAFAVRLDDVPAVRHAHEIGAEFHHLVGHLRREDARVHPIVQVLRVHVAHAREDVECGDEECGDDEAAGGVP